jgi:glycerol-3-phosphate dehydrogenase
MPEVSYDVVIVGAGVIGSAIAWRLSQDRLRVLWLEAAEDVAEGASKANSAIACSGFDLAAGTLESTMVRRSSPRWEEICSRLDVPFRRVGELVLAMSDADEQALVDLQERATRNGVETELLDLADVRRLVPAVSAGVRRALHVSDEGIIDPIRLTIGYGESAVLSGVELRLGLPVVGFRCAHDGSVTHVETPQGAFATRSVINAAGLGAGLVAAAAGDQSLRLWPRKGQFLVIDRDVGRTVAKVLAPPPSERTRGVLAIPTTNGSLLLGPTAEDIDDVRDKHTDVDDLNSVFAQAQRLLPGLRPEHVIKTFAGLRPASTDGYRVAVSETTSNLIHAAGIRSTGVSSSPAVADRVHALLRDVGVSAHPRQRAARVLPRSLRLAEMSGADAVALATRDPAYRTIVCACEHVSAAEVRQAATSPIPARSIDAIRKRTRATGGRCQGSYCAVGVGFILSTEHGFKPSQVPQSGPLATWGVEDD